MTLQLTSLLDMFTIILVFLLVSFQAEDKGFTLNSSLALPLSNAKSPFKTGINLAITNKSISVEGKEVFKLEKGGDITDKDFESGKLESVVTAINQAWKLIKKESSEEDIVVIQADKGLPYRTIHTVMRSAAFAGVFRFRLVVEKE